MGGWLGLPLENIHKLWKPSRENGTLIHFLLAFLMVIDDTTPMFSWLREKGTYNNVLNVRKNAAASWGYIFCNSFLLEHSKKTLKTFASVPIQSFLLLNSYTKGQKRVHNRPPFHCLNILQVRINETCLNLFTSTRIFKQLDNYANRLFFIGIQGRIFKE